MTSAFKYSLDLMSNKANQTGRIDSMEIKCNKASIEMKRLAILEQSIYVEGVKVDQHQDKIGFLVVVIISVVLASIAVSVFA